MKPFFAALRFLTILPVPVQWCGGPAALSESVRTFPLVGLVLGGLAAGAATGFAAAFPPLPAAVLLTALLAAFSGGFHLDGLSDAADGFFSSRPRARVLEIMRDSHIGAMGVIALVLVLMLKAAALASLPAADLPRVAFLMPLAGRAVLPLVIALVPYARPSGGLGTAFFARKRPVAAVLGILLLVLFGISVAGTAGLAAAGCAVLAALFMTAWSLRRIGGATGDTLGATCELAELAPALLFAILAPRP
jgi:adenosylcobinamide-GDP ribazoletransferase